MEVKTKKFEKLEKVPESKFFENSPKVKTPRSNSKFEQYLKSQIVQQREDVGKKL